MKLGIIGAMAQEVEILKNTMQNLKVTEIAGCNIFEGQINNKEIALLQSGIGKVAAGMGTALFLQLTKSDCVINTGSAGGIDKKLNVGDIVISSEACYHDVDVTAFGYKKGQLPANPETFKADKKLAEFAFSLTKEAGENAVSGLICSGDFFVNSGEMIAQIRKDFPQVIAVEMEAAAIAQVCHAFKTPFVVVRAISDVADKKSHLSFDEFLPLAAQKSSKIVLKMIDSL